VLSSIKLIYDTYLWEKPKTDLRVVWSDRLDYFFTVSFALESLLKAVAFGFIMENNSYMRETWSQLDFFIVVTSLIDAGLTNVELPVIKILRLLRILRPLRFISHNSSMKTVVTALLQSLGPIINVGIVVMVVFLMFAILGVNLFGGKF
jgi:Ion transport protein